MSTPFGATFGYDQRVTWDEMDLGIMASGIVVTPMFDALGNPTQLFVVRPDDEFKGLVSTDKNGWAHRHVKLDNLRKAHDQRISFW